MSLVVEGGCSADCCDFGVLMRGDKLRVLLLCPLIFNLYVSLYLKWVSCRQRLVGSCVLIHSDNLCPLMSVFRPLVFKMIVDIVA